MRFNEPAQLSTGTEPEASIRAREVFAKCIEVRAWDASTAKSCPVLVTDKSNVNIAGKPMENVPRMHIGIYLSGTIWHYSNSRSKVVALVLRNSEVRLDSETQQLRGGNVP